VSDFFLLMSKPLLACLILTGIHAYFGLHVLERKIIFVDLALAQIAALGSVIALLFGLDLHGQAAYLLSLAAAFAGAAIFSAARTRREKIPQEAVIGIVYAASTAAAVLILSRTAEGDEHIRHMLAGNILLVTKPEIFKMAVLYTILGAVHWKFRKPFFLISSDPERAYKEGLPVRRWDLFFYLTFALVVTSSVGTAGVLLVFSYLIVPAAAALLFAESFKTRLLIAWGVGMAASLAGTGVSYGFDLPTGASVVSVLAVLLGLLVLLKRARRRRGH
jgi:zinc/manganese transport system permease protein